MNKVLSRIGALAGLLARRGAGPTGQSRLRPYGTAAAAIALLFSAMSASAAPPTAPAAPKARDDRPAGTKGSGAITVKQMSNLQFLIAKKYGLVVNYVLPPGWDVVDEARDSSDPKKPGVYAVLGKRKTPDPNQAADFIFELDIFQPDILASIPASYDSQQRGTETGKRFEHFLSSQMSVNLHAGFKVVSSAEEIVPKPYGPTKGRPQTNFVPVRYYVPPPPSKKHRNPEDTGPGADLFTFTSLTGGHVWQLKFLVSKDQEANYESLIAVILNNTFGLTDEQYAKLLEETKKYEERQKAEQAKNGGKPKPKGKP